jgi:hypothetical protein
LHLKRIAVAAISSRMSPKAMLRRGESVMPPSQVLRPGERMIAALDAVGFGIEVRGHVQPRLPYRRIVGPLGKFAIPTGELPQYAVTVGSILRLIEFDHHPPRRLARYIAFTASR